MYSKITYLHSRPKSEQNPSLRSGQAGATIAEEIVVPQECDATEAL